MRNQKKKGQILVEVVISLLVLIILLFGSVEVGNSFLMSYRLSTAAREALRYAIVMPQLGTGGNNRALTGMQYRLVHALQEMKYEPSEVYWELIVKDPNGNEKGRASSSTGINVAVEQGAILELRLEAP